MVMDSLIEVTFSWVLYSLYPLLDKDQLVGIYSMKNGKHLYSHLCM